MRGVRHQRSPAYLARMNAKELDKQLARMRASKVPRAQLDEAERGAEEAWSKANALSREATHTYSIYWQSRGDKIQVLYY